MDDNFITSVDLYIDLLQHEIKKLITLKKIYANEKKKPTGVVTQAWFNEVHASINGHIEELNTKGMVT